MPHAKCDEGVVFSYNNLIEGNTALVASSDCNLWAHLMNLKAELEGIMGMVKYKMRASKPILVPNFGLRCKVCGFTLEAQNQDLVLVLEIKEEPVLLGLGVIGKILAEESRVARRRSCRRRRSLPIALSRKIWAQLVGSFLLRVTRVAQMWACPRRSIRWPSPTALLSLLEALDLNGRRKSLLRATLTSFLWLDNLG